MAQQRVSRDVLRRAAEVVGGEESLAVALGCTLSDIREWLHTDRDMPLNVYLEACRLLSDNPFRVLSDKEFKKLSSEEKVEYLARAIQDRQLQLHRKKEKDGG